MSLKERLAAQIAQDGPMTVAQYMTACLYDPQDGYYATRPALGANGDFITAPLVSQMFGELIGLWAVETWRAMGAPNPFRLVEVGPGDGTLMSDILRAGRLMPPFMEAADLWMIEVSDPLMARQMGALKDAPMTPTWAPSIDVVEPGAPVILIANELLDCLPASQFVQTASGGWVEKMVTLDDQGRLSFALTGEAPEGALVLEVSAAQESFGASLGALLAREGGAALLIDYGRSEAGFGDTFQALAGHGKVDPLEEPGAADLTVHVDFPTVLAAAEAQGCESAIAPQGMFLKRLGIEHRAAALARAKPERSDTLKRQMDRLIQPDQMGDLFKAAAVYKAGQPQPPGFEDIVA
ncbi:MAG: class I SAM-dependent methyltransferase [Brevundimonas sp.]|nr:MAG: class I SAM-dependent methyltransferase [Brevundimonas sp.]